jgi:hypothetical protein
LTVLVADPDLEDLFQTDPHISGTLVCSIVILDLNLS